MKLGLITDIHENVPALAAALRECRRSRVDRVVVLGDLFEYGHHIEETCSLLAEARAVGVWGNHDFPFCMEPESSCVDRY
ncbi:MAG: hypothetical protein RIS70_1486, partial [Planctomycetota bacterium]